MAAIDFPSSPVNGQIFGNYTYDSGVGVWRATPQVASGLPAGTIVQWPGITAPTSWLICDGSAVSRSTYASLFSAIGTTYGSGDGTTTFNLPNLKGRVAVGRDASQTEFDTLGETGGAKTHTLLVSEMPSHTHVQDAHNHTQNSHNHTQDAHGHVVSANSFAGDRQIAVGPLGADGDKYSFTDSGNDASTSTANIYARNTTATNQATTATNNATTATNQNTGGGGAHNNLQPYIVLNYIIKTSAGVTAGDSELATRVGNVETLKAPLANPTFTGAVVLPSTTSIGLVSDAEIGYLDGVTSAIQTQLNAKAALAGASFTGNVSSTGKLIGTTQPNAGSDGGVAVKAPASGTQTSGYLQFVDNAYTAQYGAISASPSSVMTLSATQVSLPTKTYAPGAVVQVAYADTGPNKYTIAAQDITAITGLSISFTPKFANSRIVLQANIHSDQFYVSTFGFLKNGGYLASNTNTNSAGSISTNYHWDSGNNGGMWTCSYAYSEFPNTTSAITYAAAGCSSWGGTVVSLQINDRGSSDMRSISSMIIMEIAQ